MTAAALSLTDIRKAFGDTVALDGAHCTIARGTVHALLGENGAGKTTLMRIAFGMLAADAGIVQRDGRPLALRSERDAIAAGIGMVHQHFLLVPAFTVAENAALGGQGRFDARAAARRITELARDTGLQLDPAARIADLPVGAQQRAELLRALAKDAEVLILDEPTAVLTPQESEELYAWIRRFAAGGGTVVLITHKLREALAVADDVTVLRRGRTVLTGRSDALNEDDVVAAIVGERVSATGGDPLRASDGDVLFALEGAGWTDARGVTRLQPSNVVVRRGEILGVLGVEGSGHRELLRLLAGRLTPTVGRVRHPPRVGFIPEDRLHDAVIPEFTLAENQVLADAGARRGLVDWSAEAAAADDIIRTQDVRAAGALAPMRTLSGGNQQRFVVGRERRGAPDALVAENPTRGLDVRATTQVLQALRDTAVRDGGAVIVHSADLDEVLALTSRVVVCYAGRVTEIAPPADPQDRGVYARALVGAVG